MREVSLAILDVAQNSIDAHSELIQIELCITDKYISFKVSDDGCGMDERQLAEAAAMGVSHKGSTGLGLALLEKEVTFCGGSLQILSQKDVGTEVFAKYCVKNGIPMLGNLGATFVTLVDEGYDVVLTVNRCGKINRYDTRELKSSFGVADLQSLGALRLIREEINQNN